LAALEELVRRIDEYDPCFAVVLVGFDTLSLEYIQDCRIRVAAKDFKTIGKIVGTIAAPKLYLLEGGYELEHLGGCARNFFTADV
jgi:acetoin utilization deacetylase AcuC-like enzyme